MVHKQELIDKITKTKIRIRKPHDYRVREKVIVCDEKSNKYKETYNGTYPITRVLTKVYIAIFWGTK